MTTSQGVLQPRGDLRLSVTRRSASVGLRRKAKTRVSMFRLIKDGFPQFGLSREVNKWRIRNCWSLLRPMFRVALIQFVGGMAMVPTLRLTLFRDGQEVYLGLASMKVVTDTGVGYIVDAMQNSVEAENLKYHGYGTGTGAEAAGDTGLGTELTTQYATDSTRPTGSTTEGASANIFRSVGTLAPDSGGTIAITEHGLFSANSAGVLLDRSKFSAVNLVAGADSLQTTYDLTLTSGS